MKIKALIIFGLSLLSLPAFSQDKAAPAVPQPHPAATALPDSIIKKMNDDARKITELTVDNSSLKRLLKESQNETLQKESAINGLNRQINELQNELHATTKRLEAKNDTLQRRLISMASNFLYIPYEEYSIQEIAIPAFHAAKGTPAFTRYQDRLTLLENYKGDISTLVEFIMSAENENRLSLKMDGVRAESGQTYLNKLRQLPMYINYRGYDDWKNTFLGNRINRIEKLLLSHPENIKSSLEQIRVELQRLLNDQ